MKPLTMALLLPLFAAASLRSGVSTDPLSQDSLDGERLPGQSLDAPYGGQHVGVSLADLNGDGAIDLLFAAGRHWVDQSFALINLGTIHDNDGEFEGVRFSEALPLGPPGAYYQIDVTSGASTDDGGDDGSTVRSTVLLAGGTCHFERKNSFGSCKKGENTPARVLEVAMGRGESDSSGCSIFHPDAPCRLDYEQVWEHPDPMGDRNGGFATFSGRRMIALLGQGGIELFESVQNSTPNDNGNSSSASGERFLTAYSSVYHQEPPPNTDPRSDYARYAGFASGSLPSLGGTIAAGRRSDYDAPQVDNIGNIIGINKLVYEGGGGEGGSQSFRTSTLSPSVSGEPYPGNPNYSIQSTNYAFADIDGDGVQDLLEATFLYRQQRVPGWPLPQKVHLLSAGGTVKKTLVVLEDGVRMDGDGKEDEDAGRSVTSGQIFSDSALPDVVFASAEGMVTLFANLGVDEETGEFRGLELRHKLSVGTDGCQVRDIAIARMSGQDASTGRCQVGIVCAVTCGIDFPGRNHIFYLEGHGKVCDDNEEVSASVTSLADGVLAKKIVE